MTAKRSALWNGMIIGPNDANAGVWDLTPWTDFSWCDEVTFTIAVLSTWGSPTSGSLIGTLQLGIPSYSGLQYQSKRLANFDAAQKSTLIAEGEDFGTIATFATASTVIAQRTVRNFGSMLNLHLDASSFAGGSNPEGVKVSFTLTQKGRL